MSSFLPWPTRGPSFYVILFFATLWRPRIPHLKAEPVWGTKGLFNNIALAESFLVF
jgi:hypothetical protein